jgi:hypothetical protein
MLDAATARAACSRKVYDGWRMAMKMSKLGYFSEPLLLLPPLIIASLLAFRSSIPLQPAILAIVCGG